MSLSASSVKLFDMDTLAKVSQTAARVAAGNDRVSKAQAALEGAIREARESGKSLRAIGQVAGLSHEQVRLLLRRKP